MHSTRLPRMQALTVALVAAVCILTGCNTPESGDGPEVMRIHLAPGNRITQNGREIPVDDAGHRMKRMGATLSTRIEILLAEDTSSETVRRLSRSLVDAGLPRIVIIRPRTATATVVPRDPRDPRAPPRQP